MLFIFGRTPELSRIELQCTFPDAFITVLHPRVVRADNIAARSPSDLLEILGGTTKIAKVIRTIHDITPEGIASALLSYSKHTSIVFGVSSFVDSFRPTRSFLQEVKHALEKSGRHVRFIESKEGDELSSVVVAKQNIEELVLVPDAVGYSIAITEAVQDFEQWNKRDYGRPYADPRLGMLPPKVARMAVNLARESKVPSERLGTGKSQKSKVLLDPFCGMGTILAEALLTGWDVYGSDFSDEVIEKAKKNIEWLKSIYPQVSKIPCQFFIEDATHIGKHIKLESIDAIVTEPFMGRQEQTLDREKVKDIIKGLEKLYIGCFKEWHNLLKSTGVIVIALPEYVIKDTILSVKKVVDNCENLGYTRLVGPIAYGRPDALVRRKFYIFQKNSSQTLNFRL